MDFFPDVTTRKYDQVHNDIRSGDLLLCSGSSLMSNMIQQATNSVWSHVAFILRLDVISRLIVLESVESIGVRAVPLSSYAFDYNGTGKPYPGRIMIARHRDFKQKNITNISKHAIDLLGYPYDTEEIIRIVARIGMNSLGIIDTNKDPITSRAFICSEYAYECFKSVGIIIDYNPIGFIAPADFAHNPKVEPLHFIETATPS
jgi:hypothetical protein